MSRKLVLDSLRLAHEPSGLVFDAAGDNAFVTLPGSGIARHRLTQGLPLAANQNPPTQPPTMIDLNTAVDNTLQAAGYACSMPTEMAPTADFGTIYVACYEPHNVAVVDTAAGTFPQSVAVRAQSSPRPSCRSATAFST